MGQGVTVGIEGDRWTGGDRGKKRGQMDRRDRGGRRIGGIEGIDGQEG